MSELSDFLKSINSKSELTLDPKKYPKFIGNRILSYHRDCLQLVNEVQQYDLDADIVYRFLRESIPKAYRYKQYHKVPEDLYELRGNVSKYYQVSIEEADKIIPTLTVKDLKNINQILDEGGIVNKTKK
jgi:hypothetical protein